MADNGPLKMPTRRGPIWDAMRDFLSGLTDTLLVPASAITDTGAYATNAAWNISNFSLRQMTGTIYYLALNATPTGTITVNADGDITDSTVCTLAVDYRPPYAMGLAMTGTGILTGGYIGASGNVVMSAVTPGTVLNSSKTLQLSGLIILPRMPS